MPGTMTRSLRVRNSGLTRPRARGDSAGTLTGRHVVLVGADASPHITGFPGFAAALRQLLRSRAAQVSLPLDGPRPRPADPRDDRPVDLVVGLLPGAGSAAAAVELADMHRAPLLMLAQGETLPPEEAAARTGRAGAELTARLEARALQRADHWGAAGELAHRRLLRLGVPAARIDRIAHAYDPSTFPAPSATILERGDAVRSARRRLGWRPGPTVVCPVGVRVTAAPAVIAAAVELAARRPDVRVVLVGRGPRLRALASTHPGVLVADVTDDDYAPALAAADVVLVAESGAPDPASAGRLAAALAAGKPVVAAVDPAGHLHDELLTAEGAVVTVPLDDTYRLAAALHRLVDDVDARAVMAASARHYARAALGPSRAALTLEILAGRAMRTPEPDDDAAGGGRTR